MKEKKILTARLSSGGMLRIPKELLPPDKLKEFVVTAFPVTNELVLWPNGGNGAGPVRKAMYSNRAARSPQVCVMSALRFLLVQPTKRPKDFPIKKKKDGSLVVTF